MKIIQLNIFRGAYLTNALEFLKKEDPDIITLQEVAVSPSLDIFQSLKEALGMEGVFSPIYGVKTPEGTLKSGNVILSKHKIVSNESKFFDCPYQEYDKDIVDASTRLDEILKEPKNYILAKIQTPEGSLHVATTHLVWSKNCTESERRISQAKKLLETLEGKSPAIITGDFNIHPNSPTLQILEKEFTNLAPNITNTLDPKTHNAFKHVPEGFCVDYILGRNVTGKVRASQESVSDHLALVGEITLE